MCILKKLNHPVSGFLQNNTGFIVIKYIPQFDAHGIIKTFLRIFTAQNPKYFQVVTNLNPDNIHLMIVNVQYSLVNTYKCVKHNI